MSHPSRSGGTPRYKTALPIWLVIYPTITVVFAVLGPILAPLPLLASTAALNTTPRAGVHRRARGCWSPKADGRALARHLDDLRPAASHHLRAVLDQPDDPALRDALDRFSRPYRSSATRTRASTCSTTAGSAGP